MKNILKLTLFLYLFVISLNNLHSQVVIEIKPGPANNKDTYLNSYNYYADGTSHSFISAAWTYNGTFGTGRSFIEFPLPDLPGNATNIQAHLNLYHNYAAQHAGHYGENASKIRRVIEPWDANTMNWSNQPEVTSQSEVILPKSDYEDQDYTDIDVTALILDSYEDPENSFGFRLSLITEETYRSLVFASGNHTDESIRPSLILQYDTCSNTVIFDVMDEHYYTIDSAIVTFDGVTNDPGNYLFEHIEPGTYHYVVEKQGYFTVEDEVTVNDDITVEVVMHFVLYTIPFFECFTGVPVGEIPEDWARDIDNWGVRNNDKAGGEKPEMELFRNPPENGKFYLTTPVINTAGHDELHFSFKNYLKDHQPPGLPPGPYTIKVVSIVGEEEYPVKEWVYPGNMPAQEFEFIITAEAHGVGSENFRIAWVFEGSTRDIKWWRFDDILLKSTDKKEEFEIFLERPGDVEIYVFPNPARDKVTVQAYETIRRIKLIDITGQTVINIPVDALSFVISVNDLHPGAYFMEIHTEESLTIKRVQVVR